MKRLLCLLSSILWPLALLAQSTPAPAPDLKQNPAAAAASVDRILPSIFIAGDSTAARNNGYPTQGWGVPFADYFDPSKVNVVNLARGGRSSRTFISEGLWDQLLAKLKAGDTVLIQFGHNDGSPVNEDASVPPERRRSRGSIPGLGEETQDIVNIITGQPETIHTFGWYVRKMIADVKAKGATPIVLSLTVRNIWQDGRVERGSGRYRQFDREIAAAAGVQFLDLTRIVADKYQELGREKVQELFGTDHTHTNTAGADLNAASVVSALKAGRNSPYAKLLSTKGEAVEPDRTGYLNLPEPADARLPSIVLVGDSLVRNGRGDGGGGQWGWGDSLGKFFDPAKVNIVNRAVGGLSSRTYITQGHWSRALSLIKPGDFVIIQLGHNDGSPVNESASTPPQSIRARGTLKGVGEEIEEVASNILTKQPETVHTYGWYIRKIVREAKAAGATPIVTSLTPRKTWKDGRIVRSGPDGYGGWARQVAEQEGVAFIDTNNLIATRYETLGADKLDPLFGDANLHTSKAGADLNAEILAAELLKLPGLGEFKAP